MNSSKEDPRSQPSSSQHSQHSQHGQQNPQNQHSHQIQSPPTTQGPPSQALTQAQAQPSSSVLSLGPQPPNPSHPTQNGVQSGHNLAARRIAPTQHSASPFSAQPPGFVEYLRSPETLAMTSKMTCDELLLFYRKSLQEFTDAWNADLEANGPCPSKILPSRSEPPVEPRAREVTHSTQADGPPPVHRDSGSSNDQQSPASQIQAERSRLPPSDKVDEIAQRPSQASTNLAPPQRAEHAQLQIQNGHMSFRPSYSPLDDMFENADLRIHGITALPNSADNQAAALDPPQDSSISPTSSSSQQPQSRVDASPLSASPSKSRSKPSKPLEKPLEVAASTGPAHEDSRYALAKVFHEELYAANKDTAGQAADEIYQVVAAILKTGDPRFWSIIDDSFKHRKAIIVRIRNWITGCVRARNFDSCAAGVQVLENLKLTSAEAEHAKLPKTLSVLKKLANDDLRAACQTLKDNIEKRTSVEREDAAMPANGPQLSAAANPEPHSRLPTRSPQPGALVRGAGTSSSPATAPRQSAALQSSATSHSSSAVAAAPAAPASAAPVVISPAPAPAPVSRAARTASADSAAPAPAPAASAAPAMAPPASKPPASARPKVISGASSTAPRSGGVAKASSASSDIVLEGTSSKQSKPPIPGSIVIDRRALPSFSRPASKLPQKGTTLDVNRKRPAPDSSQSEASKKVSTSSAENTTEQAVHPKKPATTFSSLKEMITNVSKRPRTAVESLNSQPPELPDDGASISKRGLTEPETQVSAVKKLKSGKRVRWKEDSELVSVRYIESNPHSDMVRHVQLTPDQAPENTRPQKKDEFHVWRDPEEVIPADPKEFNPLLLAGMGIKRYGNKVPDSPEALAREKQEQLIARSKAQIGYQGFVYNKTNLANETNSSVESPEEPTETADAVGTATTPAAMIMFSRKAPLPSQKPPSTTSSYQQPMPMYMPGFDPFMMGKPMQGYTNTFNKR